MDVSVRKVRKYIALPGGINVSDVRLRMSKTVMNAAVFGVIYLAPAIMTLFLAAMLKRLGRVDLGICPMAIDGLHGLGLTGAGAPVAVSVNATNEIDRVPERLAEVLPEGIVAWVKSFSGVPLLSPKLLRPVFSFLTWWAVMSHFAGSLIGVLYYRGMEKRVFEGGKPKNVTVVKGPPAQQPRKSKGKKKQA